MPMTSLSSPPAGGHLGLYWGPRQTPFEECSQKVLASLLALRARGYQRYLSRGRRRAEASTHEIAVDAESVGVLLAEGVSRTAACPESIPELGWALSLWSGDPDDQAYSVAFECGGAAAWVRNSVVLTLPERGPFSIAADPERPLQAYAALVEIWQPDQAVLCHGFVEWESGRLKAPVDALASLHR